MATRTPKLRIVRVRHHRARQHGQHYYFHADILAPSTAAAVRAAVEGRVRNWRCVDSFNPGQPEAFSFYEVLFEDWPAKYSEKVMEPQPENPAHRWHKMRKETQEGQVFYFPKERNLELEARLRRQEKLASIVSAATEQAAEDVPVKGSAIATTDADSDATYLQDYATSFREQHRLTRHFQPHCQRFASDLFKQLRFAVKMMPKRERTKAGMAELVQRFQEIAQETTPASGKRASPRDLVEAQIHSALLVEPEFQRRALRAGKAA